MFLSLGALGFPGKGGLFFRGDRGLSLSYGATEFSPFRLGQMYTLGGGFYHGGQRVVQKSEVFFRRNFGVVPNKGDLAPFLAPRENSRVGARMEEHLEFFFGPKGQAFPS